MSETEQEKLAGGAGLDSVEAAVNSSRGGF
jgi:hypothetical protein